MRHRAALRWAAEQLGHPVLEVRRLLGGQTSTMLALRDAAGGESVLRLITEEPWRTHGAELAARESLVQAQLADTAVPAPRTIALDADGEHCGAPAHLMSLLPGAVDPAPVGEGPLAALADLLATIHDVRVAPMPRTYQPWAYEEKYVVPAWARVPGAWTEAFDVLRAGPPAHEPAFLHRDAAPRNVLWTSGRVSGVVDWVETSTGPAWLDVAHCATNLALDHGGAVADRFAAAYVARTGRAPDPWWDVLDVVGFLPRPGGARTTCDPRRLVALEARLVSVLAR